MADSVSPTVADYAELFIRTRVISPRTLENYHHMLNSEILPTFGDVALDEVRASQLRSWLADLWVKSPHTALVCRVIIRGIFELAEDDGLIDRSPATRLRLRTPPRSHHIALTADEVRRLIAAMPQSRDRLMTEVMAYGGLRFGETAALSPHDLTAVGLHVHRSVQPKRGGGWLWGDTKSHQDRYVVLPAGLYARLTDFRRGRVSKPLLFASAANTPVHRGNWHNRVLKPALLRAGLPPITPHDLRRSCASMLAAAGVPVIAASQHLGHSDATVTMKHYLAADTSSARAVARALDDLYQQGA